MNDVPFKNCRVLFCFCSTIDEHTDGVDKMFPFAKQDSEWSSKYEPKNN